MIFKERYLARRFDDVLQTVPEQDKALVEALIKPLNAVTAFYREQRTDGFYGGLDPFGELPLDGDSPYTIIRANGGYTAHHYVEIEPYKKCLREIAKAMDDAIAVASTVNDPEKDLFRVTLESRATALWRGEFAKATYLGINTRTVPRYHLYIGLLDRYLDPRGIHLAMQGWLQRIDPDQKEAHNNLAAQISGHRIPKLRIIYGDMLAAGGLTSEKPWNGNTVPSEDNIRQQVGADCYIFSNNIERQAIREEDIPAMRKYLPYLTQTSGWEDMIVKAKKLGIIAHEIGHAEIPFDEQTIKLLDGRYMAIKELLAELFSVKEIERLPKYIVSSATKQACYARSLALWRYYIDLYQGEQNSDKKRILEHYAKAGAWRINYHERLGSIIVKEDGTIQVADWDKFVERERDLYREILSAIGNERFQQGFVERIINLNSCLPRNYMEENCNFSPYAVA